jgi:hypothetical protein
MLRTAIYRWATDRNCIDEARLRCELLTLRSQHMIRQRPITGAPFGETAKA